MLANITTARGKAILLAATSGLFLLHATPVVAEEEMLRFRLVVQQVGEPTALPEIGGHKLKSGRYMGVAVFEDGRIAHKRFVEVADDTAEAGTYKGYSTYTFVNGDSLTLSYTGAGTPTAGVASTKCPRARACLRGPRGPVRSRPWRSRGRKPSCSRVRST
jgi:hypothetical protein